MSPRGRRALMAAPTIAAVCLAGCATTSSPAAVSSRGPGTLVIDTEFDLKSNDPARQHGSTGAIVGKAVYETLLTLADDNHTKLVDGLARHSLSPDATRLVLTIKAGHRFSDGRSVTADDVVFSLNRVKGIGANPASLLEGVTVAKTNATTVTLTSRTANPGLPFRLTNPALGVVSRMMVRTKGGTADTTDGAAEALNTSSAGSGPYQLQAAQPGRQITLVRNPRYGGPRPAFEHVVLRNVPPHTQQLNVQGGDSSIALDLTSAQASTLSTTNVRLTRRPSPTVVFLLLNQRTSVSRWTADQDVVTAVRVGLDHQRLVEVAGPGSTQPGGIVPAPLVGSLPADPPSTRDVAAARAAVKASGYSGSPIRLSYPSDLTVHGMPLSRLAAAIRDQLAEVGLRLTLAPAPMSTELQAFRGGREQLGLWYWTPDYPDPSNYLTFAPGGPVASRANWTPGEQPAVDAAARAAAAATGTRREAAFRTFQRELNRSGPFIPLVQPPRNIASTTALTELALNPIWTLDVARVK